LIHIATPRYPSNFIKMKLITYLIKDSLEKLTENRTTIVIAHRLSTVRNAQKILVLTDKGIAQQGTHEELIALDGNYANLYNMQLKI